MFTQPSVSRARARCVRRSQYSPRCLVFFFPLRQGHTLRKKGQIISIASGAANGPRDRPRVHLARRARERGSRGVGGGAEHARGDAWFRRLSLNPLQIYAQLLCQQCSRSHRSERTARAESETKTRSAPRERLFFGRKGGSIGASFEFSRPRDRVLAGAAASSAIGSTPLETDGRGVG